MGRARFYADENVEMYLVPFIRERGYRIEYAPELGLSGREDTFHLQEARKRKSVLLTRDTDFLDDQRFPFHNLQDTAIVVIRIATGSEPLDYGYMITSLLDEVGASGNKSLFGLKIQILGHRIIFRARIGGSVRTDVIDVRTDEARDLFP